MWCEAKKHYDTYHQAERVLKHILRRGNMVDRKHEKLEIYFCKEHHKWEIGSTRKEPTFGKSGRKTRNHVRH